MAEKKSILLRLSPKMWEEISQWAEEEFRSVNGQIEYLISDALRRRKRSYKDASLIAEGNNAGNQDNVMDNIKENAVNDIQENVLDDIQENALNEGQENVLDNKQENVLDDIQDNDLEGSEGTFQSK